MLREIIEDIAPQSGFNLLAMLVFMYGVEAVEETFEEVKAAQQSFLPDEACAVCKSTYFVKRNDGVEICDSCSTPRG